MNKKHFILLTAGLAIAAYVTLLFYDYQFLLDRTITFLAIRWGLIALVLVLALLWPGKKALKSLVVIMLLAGFVLNEQYRPLRKTALKSFIKTNHGKYMACVGIISQDSLVHSVIVYEGTLVPIFLDSSDQEITTHGIDGDDLFTLLRIYHDIGLVQISVEDQQWVFMHLQLNPSGCGLVYFEDPENRHAFRLLKTRGHMLLWTDWYYASTVQKVNALDVDDISTWMEENL